MFSCTHKKFGPVDSKGYQYCLECNKAVLIGVQCSHIWVIIREFELVNTIRHNITGHLCIQQCELCGELKKFSTK